MKLLLDWDDLLWVEDGRAPSADKPKDHHHADSAGLSLQYTTADGNDDAHTNHSGDLPGFAGAIFQEEELIG